MKPKNTPLPSIARRVLSLLAFAMSLLSISLSAQSPLDSTWACGHVEHLQHQQAINPAWNAQRSQLKAQIDTWVAQNPTGGGGPYTIPVVVHVLHDGDPYGTGSNITYAQIQWQIAALNAAFSASYPAYNLQAHGPYASPTQIRFCLATLPMGNDSLGNPVQFFFNNTTGQTECGVMRYNVPTTFLTQQIDPAQIANSQQQLLSTTHNGTQFPFARYMNVWLVNQICNGTACGVIGYGSFPGSLPLDGIVFRADVFGDNTVNTNNFALLGPLDQGKIMAHEAGHYLNLFHTFHPNDGITTGVCAGTSITNCATSGDEICDTPPSSLFNNTFCNFFPNTCVDTLPAFGNVDEPDMMENYMCYSDDNCMNTFTFEQGLRMEAVLNVSGGRDTLSSPANHLLTGVSNNVPCACNILATGFAWQIIGNPCGQVQFVASTSSSMQTGVTYSWDFGDSSPIQTGLQQTHTYAGPGTYIVTLTITDANGNTTVITDTIVIPGGSVRLYNNNNIETVCEGSEVTLQFEFTGIAPYEVVVSNGTNSDTLNTQSFLDALNVQLTDTAGTFETWEIVQYTFDGCVGTILQPDSVHYNIRDCNCNIFVNGDFEDTTTIAPSTTPLPFNTVQNVGRHYVAVNQLPFFGWGLHLSIPPMGRSMFVDEFGIFQFSAPTNHNRVICQNIFLLPNKNYRLDFITSGDNQGNAYQQNPHQSDISWRLLANTTTYLGNTTRVLKNVPNDVWMHGGITFNSGALSGTTNLCLCQISTANIGGLSDDYLLDNITLRAMDPPPTVEAFSDTAICAGQSVILTSTASPGSSQLAYLWQPGNDPDSSLTVSPALTQAYILTVTDSHNCTAADTITVTVHPVPNANAGSDALICANASTQLNASGGNAYSWSPITGLSNSNIANPVASPTVTTTYIVTVSDTTTGCSDQDTVTVTVQPPVFADAGTTRYICAGDTVHLHGSGNGSFSWSPPANLNNPNIANPIATVTVTTTYTLTVSFPNGCSAVDSVTVNTVQCCPQINGINTGDQERSTDYGLSFNNNVPVHVAINGTFYVDNQFLLINFFGPNRLSMAPDAEIVIKQGAKLTAINCVFEACTDMWKGIRIEQGGELELINCTVRDAKAAVTSQEGAKYTINQSTLTRNYKGLVVEPYKGIHPGTIFASKIIGSILTLPPHVGIRSHIGVQVTLVDSIMIGVPGSLLNENVIRDVEIGIKSDTSIVRISRNIIKNITNPNPFISPTCCATNSCQNPNVCIPPVIGVGIWLRGGKAWIGGTTVNDSNTVRDVTVGILSEQDANIDVRRNEFRQITAGNFTPTYCIWVRNNKAIIHEIRGNLFQNIKNGIYYEFNAFSGVFVTNNTFNNFTAHGLYAKQNQDVAFSIQNNGFNATTTNTTGKYAIRLQNAIINTQTSNAFIAGNIIKRCEKGIWLTKYPLSQITQGNSIEFPNQIPVPTSFGIQVQYSEKVSVESNHISKLGPIPATNSTLRTKLYGISMETNCFDSRVFSNSLIKLGTGLNFFNSNNFPITVSCNNLTNSNTQIALNNTFIGDQGSGININFPNGLAHDNQFNFPQQSFWYSLEQINGAPTCSLFCRTNAIVDRPSGSFMFPAGYFFTLGPFPNAPQICPSNCPNPPCNQQQIAMMVRRQAPFNGMNSDALFLADQSAFEKIKADPQLTQLGTPDDTVLSNFYDSTSVENIGKISKVGELLTQGDTVQAAQQNAGISPDVQMEGNHKIVQDVYIRTWARNIPYFSPDDSAALYMVAIQNVFTGGLAVYDARVMLGLDVDDVGATPAARMAGDIPVADFRGTLYPNPTTGEAYYEIELAENESGELMLFDLLGKSLKTYKLVSGENRVAIETTDLSSGIYFYKLMLNGEHKASGKLILNK